MNVLPPKDDLTIRWLIQNIPLSWIASLIAGTAAIASISFYIGKISTSSIDGDISKKIEIKDNLNIQIAQLETKKESLETQIKALKIEKSIEQMTPQERREALRERWSY